MAGSVPPWRIESNTTLGASKEATPAAERIDQGESREWRRSMGLQDSLVAPTGKEIRLTEYAACAG